MSDTPPKQRFSKLESRPGLVVNRAVAIAALALVSINCSASSDDALLEFDGAEQVVERHISGDSQFWNAAPFLIEGPFTCPIPQEATELSVPQAHESLTVQNIGDAGSLEIVLEGASFDPSLSAEPLLLVYAGEEVPDQVDAVANCLGIAKPGGGAAASVTVALAAGDSVTAIALEPEIGSGFDGSGSGTFRLRVRQQ